MRRLTAYAPLRIAVSDGRIRSFENLFKFIDQRKLFKDAGQNPYGPARKRVKDPGLFKVGEVYQLASVIGISPLVLLEIISMGRLRNEIKVSKC